MFAVAVLAAVVQPTVTLHNQTNQSCICTQMVDEYTHWLQMMNATGTCCLTLAMKVCKQAERYK